MARGLILADDIVQKIKMVLTSGGEVATVAAHVQQLTLRHNLSRWDHASSNWKIGMGAKVVVEEIKIENAYLETILHEIAYAIMCVDLPHKKGAKIQILGHSSDVAIATMLYQWVVSQLTPQYDNFILMAKARKLIEELDGTGDGKFHSWEVRNMTDEWWEKQTREMVKELRRGRSEPIMRSMIVATETDMKWSVGKGKRA